MSNSNDDRLKINNEKGRKSCAIIVTYNRAPNMEQLNRAISENEIDGLFIVDNSDRNSIISSIKEQFDHHNLGKYCLIENHGNLGISKAINIGLKKAIQEGYYFIFLLDDDAVISRNFFMMERQVFEELEAIGEHVGAVCPVVSNNFVELNKKIGNHPTDQIRQAITSGLLISAETIKNGGFYNEDFFLESADLQYTRKLTRLNLKIFRINKVLICQDFGETIKGKFIRVFPYYLFIYFTTKITFFITYNTNSRFFYPNYYEATRIGKQRESLYMLMSLTHKNRTMGFIRRLIVHFFFLLRIFLLMIATGNASYFELLKMGQKYE